MAEHVVIHAGATAQDIDELVAHLRVADRIECAAAGVTDMHQSITRGVAQSVLCWTARINGKVACIFGVVPATLLGDSGAVWMLGTSLITRHARVLMRMSPLFIDLMLGSYPHLANYVHASNRQAVRWLTRMGFVLREPVRAASGELFYPFEKRA